MDARDFFRGTRPWDQFYSYVKTLALTEGSQFWAAQLEDERFDEEVRKELAKRKAKGIEGRPALQGYTRLVAAIDELTDHIWSLRAETGRWGRPRPRAKPRYPQDRYEEHLAVIGRCKIDAILEEAHQWAREVNRTNGHV